MKKLFYCVLAMMLACVPAFGQTFKVIHSFSGYPNDGSAAISNVVFDQAGNLYGTTPGGGSGFACGDNGCGTAYQLSPNKDGSWTETVIYNFCSVVQNFLCADGAFPDAGLVLDRSGNLYGTTQLGGTKNGCRMGGCGTVFELSPPTIPGEAWTETVIYSFCTQFSGSECLDGQEPVSQMVFDSSGNLYGTADLGGSGHTAFGGGVVFELSPGANGWVERVLYNFCTQGADHDCLDGQNPSAGVTFDVSGNLFGTTGYSGKDNASSGGTVYELSPLTGGWKHKTIFVIPPQSQSKTLLGSISFDGPGNLYSTFTIPNGGLFEWNIKTKKVETFSFNGSDGENPQSGLYLDPRSGRAYGTTAGGSSSAGNFFQFLKSGKEIVLHNFCSFSDCTDGEVPWAVPVPDKLGNLYGTTEFGGDYGSGVVFEITP